MTIKKELSRRSFLKSAAAGAGAAAVPVAITGCGGDDDNDSLSVSDSKLVVAFGHGVASGDPLQDRVIIWTRVTHTESTAQQVPVAWKVATDAAMTQVVASGTVVTTEDVDYTVKIDVEGLSAETTYYYQFEGPLDVQSVVGETKTLPSGFVEQVKFAVCSCANYPAGFFNVYQAIAESDVDVVLHLGDYIYEYQNGKYPTEDDQATGRAPDPTTETLSLSDYRARYSQYRIDEQAKLVHQKKPFICVWDDHEVANDAYKDGAENHNEGEGEYSARKAAAIQAYHEWLPIRTGTDLEKIYRNFQFGELVSLNMLDTRHIGRDQGLSTEEFATAAAQSSEAATALLVDENRSLLGAEQQSWLVKNWFNSTATWEVLGQQVLMGRIFIPAEILEILAVLLGKLEAGVDASTEQAQVTAKLTELYGLQLQKNAGAPLSEENLARLATKAPYNLDAWDGYFYERENLLQRAKLMGKNLVCLAGDTHNAWASDLRYVVDTETGALSDDPVGVEFATASVTSPGLDAYLSLTGNDKIGFESAVMALVDDLQYMDASRRGFLEVTFTPEEANAQWKYVSDISGRVDPASTVSTDSNYVELKADGATPELKSATFKVKATGRNRNRLTYVPPVVS